MQIEVIHNPTQETLETLEKMNVNSWPIWEKEASAFPWTYDIKRSVIS